MDNLRAAIEQAEKQAPYIAVANDRITIDPVTGNVSIGIPAAPRQWVGLTGDEVNEFSAGCHLGNSVQGAIRAAEARLKGKNHG
jgi:hypothetical protein